MHWYLPGPLENAPGFTGLLKGKKTRNFMVGRKFFKCIGISWYQRKELPFQWIFLSIKDYKIFYDFLVPLKTLISILKISAVGLSSPVRTKKRRIF